MKTFTKPQDWLIPTMIILIFFIVVLVIVVFMGKLPGKGSGVLEIQDSVSGKVYSRYPLGKDSDFSIEFIHSVNMSPVMDTFKAEGKQISLIASRFFTYGAGMPAELEEGLTLEHHDGALVITGYNRKFNELNYIVGTVSDHLLFINGKTISLRDLCGRNAHVRIKVK